ncbi:hypothetical protein B0J13DRAFT_258610 [Dactylonectria estremocensis]|uniref:Uncharacterized protein n=1 Tax=Dactylonectria estremocensis TaxID=1079267 RepID=A0A9P9F3P1_9HYPO|nr:hypothetical protein B0J13DRAFT_258610 [Dactylonectria estremocensis]
MSRHWRGSGKVEIPHGSKPTGWDLPSLLTVFFCTLQYVMKPLSCENRWPKTTLTLGPLGFSTCGLHFQLTFAHDSRSLMTCPGIAVPLAPEHSQRESDSCQFLVESQEACATTSPNKPLPCSQVYCIRLFHARQARINRSVKLLGKSPERVIIMSMTFAYYSSCRDLYYVSGKTAQATPSALYVYF